MTAPAPSELILRKATAEQCVIANERFAGYWAAPLNTQEYVERNRVLDVRAYAKCRSKAALRDEPDSLDFLGSLVVYSRSILLNDGDGKLQRLPAHSITTVFIPKEHRYKVYGKRLVGLLHDHLRSEEPPSSCSWLFSDVGDYYARCFGSNGEAWGTQSLRELVVPLTALPGAGEVELLEEDELRPLLEHDGRLIADELRNARAPSFVVELDGDEVDWIIARCKFYADSPNVALPPLSRQTTHYGVKLQAGNELAYAVWSFDYAASRIQILRLRASTADQLRLFLAAARQAGTQQGCGHLNVWNVPMELLDEKLKVYEREMLDNWPCLAWYGKDQTPTWLYPERYTWC